jgi:hypothetical protein
MQSASKGKEKPGGKSWSFNPESNGVLYMGWRESFYSAESSW